MTTVTPNTQGAILLKNRLFQETESCRDAQDHDTLPGLPAKSSSLNPNDSLPLVLKAQGWQSWGPKPERFQENGHWSSRHVGCLLPQPLQAQRNCSRPKWVP